MPNFLVKPETPAMLPVPMDAARAVHIALKGETAPSFFSLFSNALPKVFFIMWMKWVNWGKPQPTDR